MKLNRKELLNELSNCINPQDSFEQMADAILTKLQTLDVVKSIKRKETVVRRDIELMPYDEEIVIEEFGN